MPINHTMQTHNGREVMDIDLPRNFNDEDLAQRLRVGARRAYDKQTSFCAVIRFDYTLETPSSLASMYALLDNAFTSIPEDDHQYRIAIIVKDERAEYSKATTKVIFDGPIRGWGDFGLRTLATLGTVGHFITGIQGENLPSHKNPWIQYFTSYEKGATWCVDNAPWR